jgi:hypothetical protein
LQRRAAQYTPEWRFVPDGREPGAAIAALFLEMFGQSVERLNMLPDKYYMEFLNLLGAGTPGPRPSSGYVQFESDGASGAPPNVPQGTEVFARDEDGGNIVFSTERALEVTDARLTEIFYVDSAGGRIELLPPGGERVFFESMGGENLRRHGFAVSQNDVLSVSGACEIRLELRQHERFNEAATVRRLCDPAFAVWRYTAPGGALEFDSVAADGNTVVLTKGAESAPAPDGDGRICVLCDIVGGAGTSFALSGARLGSSLRSRARADALANNTVPIDSERGGYCFGRRPGEYDLFYIRSDDVFRKKGALIDLRFDIAIISVTDVDENPQFEFNRRIIDKSDAKRVELDDVSVEEVVWEYYNGSGWAPLRVEGERNPFSGESGGGGEMRFTMPADAAATSVNSEDGYYVRARVVNVRNYLSATPRWLLPFAKGVDCAYQYTDNIPVDYIMAEDSGERRELDGAAGYTDLALKINEDIYPGDARSMYLAFDAPPEAMPLAIYFSLGGEAALGGKIIYELYAGGKFSRVHAQDDTQDLRFGGCVFLYINRPPDRARFFGRDAYWIKMSLSGPGLPSGGEPARVLGVELNTVRAVQRHAAAELVLSSSDIGEGGALDLMDRPILDCELRVGEGAADRDGDTVNYAKWETWERVDNLMAAGRDARVYELDGEAGLVLFGGGRGMMPPEGDMNIAVSYTYGGGARGNLDIGRVAGLIGSIARVTGVRNITPMSGGTDAPAPERIGRLGNRIYRNRGVPLGASDFEELALVKFPRVERARCFPNTDGHGRYAPGHVSLALMGSGAMIDDAADSLCHDVYEYFAPLSDANMVRDGMFHVVHSTEITVSAEVSVSVRDPGLASATVQAVSDAITRLIDGTWRAREIGDQIDLNELHLAVRSVPNVSAVLRILPEGRFRSRGRSKLIALDGDEPPPFATVRSGLHAVRVEMP